jgi:hypothetical protein
LIIYLQLLYSNKKLNKMDLDNAILELMRSGIYAEAGMGCTGQSP